MPELKGKKVLNFDAIEVDPATIPFKDKAREKLRQEKIAAGTDEKKIKRSRPPRVRLMIVWLFFFTHCRENSTCFGVG